MSINKKKLFFISAVLLILIASFFLFNFKNDDSLKSEKENISQDENNNSEKESKAEREFADINLNLYNNDKSVKLELSAKNLAQYEDENLLKMNPVEIRAYDIDVESDESNEDNLLYILRAERGNYDEKKGLLKLTGSVTIEKDDISFSFAEMSIDQDNGEIMAQGDVLFEAGGITVRGKRFKTNFAFDHFVFYGDNQKTARLSWKELDDGKE